MSAEICFDYTEDYVLENEIIRLSPLTPEHIPVLLNAASDHDLWTYMLEKGDNPERLKDYVSRAVQNRALGTEYPFVIYDKRLKQYAGTTRLYALSKELATIKLGHTWIGTTFQGTGLNRHGKYLMFEFLFEHVGVQRIGFGAHAENLRSIRAMEAVGCKKEGVLRDFIPYEGGRVDIVLMSILKEEWIAEVKETLKNQLFKT